MIQAIFVSKNDTRFSLKFEPLKSDCNKITHIA